ncbi:hypothetical protein KIN20_015421 [Parelaphostrongylus tenuis]|uniref:Uncharacterized protein n=1 Tax=Parelaphostrongylus tenuis TaxID=148309 RepID=A0AAD5QP02_PARTN|nr:hypothetical protein KIN20_015421 [Parelaphostrongylus tenuis]
MEDENFTKHFYVEISERKWTFLAPHTYTVSQSAKSKQIEQIQAVTLHPVHMNYSVYPMEWAAIQMQE